MSRNGIVLGAILGTIASPSQAACNIVNGQAYGDCAGVTVNSAQTPFETVAGWSTISGVSEGARVLPGGVLNVSGIAGRVIVEAGGRANVLGMVDDLEVAGVARIRGTVQRVHLVAGGQVTVEGVVGIVLGDGTATLVEGSVVGGVPTTTMRELDPAKR